MHIAIRLAGHTTEALVIDSARSACGDITGGIGAYLGNFEAYECSRSEPAGFTMSWEDFEAAYFALKDARALLSSRDEQKEKRPDAVYVVACSDGDWCVIGQDRASAIRFRNQERKRWPDLKHAVVKYVPAAPMKGKAT